MSVPTPLAYPAPATCHCCRHLAQLLHDLAGPVAALQAVTAGQQGGEAGDLLTLALARLQQLWRDKRRVSADCRRDAPRRTCKSTCRF